MAEPTVFKPDLPVAGDGGVRPHVDVDVGRTLEEAFANGAGPAPERRGHPSRG